MKKALFLLSAVAFIALLASCGSGTEGKVITRSGAAATESFNDGWLFQRYGLQPEGDRIDEPEGLENTSLDDSGWKQLDLPHDWAIEGPFRIELAGETGKLPYRGIGWYRKHFEVPATDKGKQIYVDFDGAMAYAKVWVNGHYVGTWPYGYNSFRMDLTPYINFGGENLLAVRLDTENFDARWYSGGGIYRNVWIVKTDPVHVAHWGTAVTTPEVTDSAATVSMTIEIANNSPEKVTAEVSTDIFEPGTDDRIGRKVASLSDGEVSINPSSEETVSVEGTVENPSLWDIESPSRYMAVTDVKVDGRVTDTYYTPFGIRTIEFTPDNGFLLNGRLVDIKGTCNHHDHGALGSAFNLAALKRQFRILQEMGCNALRCSHNPPAPEFLDLADKMGFLVCDEAFDSWRAPKREKDFHLLYDDWHEKDLSAMVRRDRNHPSVILWSIGNEVVEQRDCEMTRHLADIVRSIDTSRPTTAGYNEPTGGYESGAAEGIDVMGLNYYYEQEDKWHQDPRYADKPSVGTETVSEVSSRGFYLPHYQRDDTTTWQVSSYDCRGWDLAWFGWMTTPDAQFILNSLNPAVAGEFVWTGFDYLGEPTPYNSDETNLLNYRNDPEKRAELAKKLEEIRRNNPPSRSSYFGIVDLAGFPKDRYYLYQSHWRPDYPMVHILPHWNWPERVGEKVPVHVYTSGDEAELFLNGRSLGRKAKTPGRDFRLIWEDVIYEPGELKVVAYKNGEKWAEGEMRTTGSPAAVGLTADRSSVEADGTDLVYITASVNDADGLTVPRSDNRIRFTVDGPGRIVATDNGDATSFESFQSPERNAFNGLALAIVMADKGAKGTIRVKAESEGLDGSSIEIPVK